MDRPVPNVSQREEVEKEVSAIWAQILDQPAVPMNEEFIYLGGDSLLAMKCIARIRQKYGIDLDFDNFFVEPATVASMSAAVISRLHSVGCA